VAGSPDLEQRAALMRALVAELDGELRWLRERHGYRPAGAEWPAVWLEARASLKLAFVSAHHGLKIVLGGSVAERESLDRIGFDDAAELLGARRPDLAPLYVERAADVPPAAARLSGELRAIEPLLAGDAEAFQTARRRHKEAVTQISLEYALEDAGRDAGEAWRERDLDRVIAILEPLEGHLERHQQGWLDYARRKRAG
jgi:hypothetical protein